MKNLSNKIFGLAFFAYLILWTSCSFTQKQSAKLYEIEEFKTYDVIVVPGVPFENGQMSKTMKARVYWSKILFDKGIAKNVMYSGSAVYSPYVEAEIMARYGEALGIPKENIYKETKAEHSTENIYYSYKYSQKLGFKTVALASDPFQTKMLKGFAKKLLNEEIGFIPIVYDSLRVFDLSIEEPQIEYEDAIVEDFISLPDREGFFERFRGTQGRKIDKEAYN